MLKIVRRLFGGGSAETRPPAGSEINLSRAVLAKEAEPNFEAFSRSFVAANLALAKGNTEGLKEALELLAVSLPEAGSFRPALHEAIKELKCGLSHHDRANTKGPWNRDFSGYAVMSWKNDLYLRDQALRRAWSHLEPINNELLAMGWGWQIDKQSQPPQRSR